MTATDPRLAAAIAAIDAANACDPNTIEADGRLEPGELVYGRRMSETLARLAPDASVHLQIAARGQHIERWTSPRKSYPDGRAGYLQVAPGPEGFPRQAVCRDHGGRGLRRRRYRARRLAGAQGKAEARPRSADAGGRGLRRLPRALCRRLHGQDRRRTNSPDILAKTWRKMSPLGHEHALRLALPPDIPRLLEQGLARQRFASRIDLPAYQY